LFRQVPTVDSTHSSISFFKKKVHSHPVKKWYTNYCLTLFDKLVSVSGYTAQFIPKKLLDKVTIIPNGVDLEVDKTHQLIQDKILTVGSTSQRKGQLNVVHALPSLLKSYPNAHYYMIGLEGYKEKIASKAELLYIPDHCHLLGKLSDAEMYEQYRQTEVYMLLSEHTSDGDFEGFGISVLEANYFGVPAIGSKNSGIEDAIEDGKTGILVDPHQPEQILLAYKTIKENYNFFSENALNWAEKHHWCKIVNRYQEVIESLYSR
jgi:phosphatidylinositol alpha-1,6-mannosyltransferase